MKRINVVANAQYDFNDLCARFVEQTEIEKLAANGIKLEINYLNEGVERVKSQERIDVLIVDGHSWKCSEDIEALCRTIHPEAKVVMIDSYCWDAEKKRSYDFFFQNFPSVKISALSVVGMILLKLGFITEKRYKRISW